jgi:hypothetical protein
VSEAQPSKISAQVVIKPEHVRDANRIMAVLRQAGYEVGPFVANNFEITGSAQHFAFGTRTSNAPETRSAQNPDAVLQRLDEETRTMIESVLFPGPPDFGPGGY